MDSMSGEIVEILFTSLRVSLVAILLATLVGVPVGIALGSNEFRGKRAVVTVLNTLMALPTVLVGLFCYFLLSRQGPLGPLEILYSSKAMVLGQLVLATPIVIGFSHAAIRGIDPLVRETALSLGASSFQASLSVLREARYGVLAAIIAGFGRAISEVGAAMMLGGNIRGHTRVMTTAIALETSKGRFELGLVLGFILLGVAFLVNLFFHALQAKK